MIVVAARIHHGFAPNSSRAAAEAVSAVLARPCFNLLTRLSATRQGRQVAHTPQDCGTLLSYLTRPENDAVVLDNARQDQLQALARIQTGRPPRGLRGPAPLLSYFIIPVEEGEIPDVVAAACDLAVSLHAVAGAITAEPTFEGAQAFTLTKSAPANGKTPAWAHTHARERATLYYFLSELDTLIPAPEWGLFLTRGHLRVLSPASLLGPVVFAKMTELEAGGLVFLQMTDTPLDVFKPDFDARLRAARELLEPILMNPSQVPERA